MQHKILISACLYGRPVRYDGAAKPLHHPAIERWRSEGRLVPFCPEMGAGLPVPRPPAEIAAGGTGADVLAGRVRVVEAGGADVTGVFIAGAGMALAIAREQGCSFALLIDGSPSCGSVTIHDGSFSGIRHPGSGVTAALLAANGIEVFSDREVDLLEARLSGQA